MIQSIFIVNASGDTIIEKHYRGMMSRAVCDFFWEELVKLNSPVDMNPILQAPKGYIFNVQRGDLYFLAVTAKDTMPLLVLEFLHRVGDIFQEYFNDIHEESLKENFVTVYQLLDEMMDNGFPFTTEPNMLRDMVRPPNLVNKAMGTVMGTSQVAEQLPDGSMSATPWRKGGVKYTNNEVYFDLVEEVDCMLDPNGLPVTTDISGKLLCNCRLSGMPDLTLSFNNPRLLDDCSFHPCVRYNRYESEKVLSFVPPDGQFTLMQYRVNAPSVNLPFYVKPQLSFTNQRGHVQITCGAKHNPLGKPAEGIVITIPFPKIITTTTLNATVGQIQFDELTKMCRWEIGKVPKDRLPQLTGDVGLQPGSEKPEENPVISVDFRVPMNSASGLKVDQLNLYVEKYKPFKGVRSMTKSGKFQIRT